LFRSRQSLAYGQVVSGDIEQRAARDIYTFTGSADDVIKIAGAGCDDSSMGLTIIDSAGHEVGRLSCRVDNYYKLPQSGTSCRSQARISSSPTLWTVARDDTISFSKGAAQGNP
jgi:hypothetical protein